jgi:glycosyltransferase involved in cell wall biosynthesis
MNAPSRTHLVLIPSYNTGGKVLQTVREAMRAWQPVWVVVDGSTDGTLAALEALARDAADLKVLSLPRNQGKGAAILHGLRAASEAGFTHALTMDADGQHPADKIREFIDTSCANPDAMILGEPVFDESAPSIRVQGRKLSNWCTGFETLGAGLADSLYGFRVYPIAELRQIMERQPFMRRFDFDAEAAVRLYWRGVRPINIPAPVKYIRPEEGGVSHFNYLRDNVLLTWMHTRLILESLLRWPSIITRRL